jgi:hypothetical protein
METALQEAIAKLTNKVKFLEVQRASNMKEDNSKITNEIRIIENNIAIIRDSLPKEREQIEQAHEAGQITAMEFANRMITKDKIESKEQYYETNFNTNKV